jgi:hypothetical protein
MFSATKEEHNAVKYHRLLTRFRSKLRSFLIPICWRQSQNETGWQSWPLLGCQNSAHRFGGTLIWDISCLNSAGWWMTVENSKSVSLPT